MVINHSNPTLHSSNTFVKVIICLGVQRNLFWSTCKQFQLQYCLHKQLENENPSSKEVAFASTLNLWMFVPHLWRSYSWMTSLGLTNQIQLLKFNLWDVNAWVFEHSFLNRSISFCCLQSRMCVTNEGCDCETTLADSLVKFLVLLLVVHDHFDNQTVIRITFTQIPTQPSHEQKFVNQNQCECWFWLLSRFVKRNNQINKQLNKQNNKVKTHHVRNNEEGQRWPEHPFWQISFLYFDWMFEVEKRRMNCE